MAKRSVTDEIQIAALSAAIELVKNSEYSREWLKTEFAEREIKSVRMTDDILDAVEFALTNQLSYIAAQMKQQLKEGIEHADAADPYETPTMKRVKQILASSDDPAAVAFLTGEEITPELAGEVIPVVGIIGDVHYDSKTFGTSAILPAGSKIGRVDQTDRAAAEQEIFDHFHAKSREFVTRAIETIMDKERAKGNEVSEAEASAILQKRLTVGLE